MARGEKHAGLEEGVWKVFGPAPVLVVDLATGLSPRSTPLRADHVTLLVGVVDALPPIVVHEPTMRVIDGAHRLEAFKRVGRDTIPAVLVNCSIGDALVMAVQANVRHGLPLSRAERRRAASTILEQFPNRSDRWIAGVVGMSHSTISALRAARPDASSHARRVGKDGRARRAPPGQGSHLRQGHVKPPQATVRDTSAIVKASLSTASPVVGGDTLDTRDGHRPAPRKTQDSNGTRSAVASLVSADGFEIDAAAFVESIPVGRLYDFADECRLWSGRLASIASNLEDRARQARHR